MTLGIHDRFIEDFAETPAEKQRAKEGWICIKDRATGKVILACANDRPSALWVIRAMNAADKTEDRLSA